MSEPLPADPLLADYARRYPAEVASQLLSTEVEQVLALLEDLPRDAMLRLLPVLPGTLLARVLERAGESHFAGWLDSAEFAAAVAVLVRLRRERRVAIIERLADHRRRVELGRRFAWPEGVLGALAGRNFLTMPMGATLADLVVELSRQELGADEEPRIYVLDPEGRMRGEVDVHRALEAEDRDQSLLRFLARVETLPAEMPLAAALEAPLWQRVLVVPVVDRDRRPMGTVTLAALREASRETVAGEQAFETVVDLAARFLEVLGGLAAMAFGGARPEARPTLARRTGRDLPS